MKPNFILLNRLVHNNNNNYDVVTKKIINNYIILISVVYQHTWKSHPLHLLYRNTDRYRGECV